MNKCIQRVICTALVFASVLPAASCSRNEVDVTAAGTDRTEQTDQTVPKTDVTTITFAVPQFCHVNDDNLKLLNEELQKDGHAYQLVVEEFECDFEGDQYFRDIENELNSGHADVAFLGFGDQDNNIFGLINSGAVMCLDELLSSDKGKAIYEAFPKALWEAVRCNGHIYSIPQSNYGCVSLYAAFNMDYLGKEAVENWDGSIEGIYNIIKDVEWNDKESGRFKYHVPDYEFEDMIGCEIRDGLLYDFDTMKIENPLESDKLIGYLKVLEQMKSDGYLDKSVSYYQNASYADDDADLESGRFLAVLSVGEPNENLLKDNIRIRRLSPCLSSLINGSIGISKNTGNLDAVADLLGLLYNGEKYGNLLMYGIQNVDYKLSDGYVVNMDGTDAYENYLTKMCLNLFINLYPVRDELFTDNRKETYFAFYDNVKVSPFIGFEADNAGDGTFTGNADKFLESLQNKSLDDAVSEYSRKNKSDGIDDYLSSIRGQWEAYNQ